MLSFLVPMVLLITGLQPSGTDTAAGDVADADTLSAAIVMPELIVTADRVGSSLATGVARLRELAIEMTDGRAIADLAPLLPATKGIVNSRGEALFMVRGASERHLPVFIEGIPLVVPWDERADLSMIPTDAIAQVHAQRGVRSVLDGPNALAGVVHLVPQEQSADGQRTRLTLQAGEIEHVEVHETYTGRRGQWHALAAVAHRQWDARSVPADYQADFHQSPRRSRTNSDLEQTALTLRLGREWSRAARLSLLLLAADGSKGVCPEAHLDAGDARFWRYPEHRRAVVGLSGRTPLDRNARWDLQASGAADFFRQEIRAFEDAGYTTPPLAPGVDYETDRDQTGYVQVQVGRRVGTAGRVTGKGVARYTRHGESLEHGGPELHYAEWITSLVAEGAREFSGGWQIVAGAGFESAITPETGDKPRRDPASDPVLQARVEKRWSYLLETYASVSRRSRFPSLRELYSGALGKFVPNPDLVPEQQDLYEAGALASWPGGTLGVSVFAGYLHGGIEKVSLPEKKFQRVNVHEIRTLGVELVTGWRPMPALRLQASHTVLYTRRQQDGDYTLPVEDRPDYVSALEVGWLPTRWLDARIEANVVGARHSADANDAGDGLRRLPAQGCWNVRLGLRQSSPGGWAQEREIFLRINNLFDQTIEYQTGLPEPGRMFLAGLKLGLGA